MLPRLDALSLKPPPCARTGEHYKLSVKKAAELERHKVIDIYTQDTPESNSDRTFRTATKRGAKNLAEDYHWFDGPMLWEWAKTHPKDPLGKPFWQEDWYELRTKYGFDWPNGAIPAFVSDLPLYHTEFVYETDPDGNQRLVRVVQPTKVMHYEGPAGQARLVRTVLLPSGNVRFYEGLPGQEHKVRMERPDGTIAFFEGPAGQEHKVRLSDPGGADQFYVGAQGQERLVRMSFRDDVNEPVYYYEGPPGQEHKVRMERPDGTIAFFEGSMGQEYLVREEVPGTVQAPVPPNE